MPERYDYRVVEVRESLVGGKMSGREAGEAARRARLPGLAAQGDHQPAGSVALPVPQPMRSVRWSGRTERRLTLGHRGASVSAWSSARRSASGSNPSPRRVSWKPRTSPPLAAHSSRSASSSSCPSLEVSRVVGRSWRWVLTKYVRSARWSRRGSTRPGRPRARRRPAPRRSCGREAGRTRRAAPPRSGRPGRGRAPRQPSEVGGERRQPSEVGGAPRGGAAGLLERDHAEQQPRSVAMADRHVPDRSQPVHAVRQAAELTTRQRHG